MSYRYLIAVPAAALLLACSASPPLEELEFSQIDQGLSLDDTHLYLRCNATGWDLTEANRLKPQIEGRLAVLDFEVTQSWLVSGGDSCVIVESNQLNAWGSFTQGWSTPGATPAANPGTQQLTASWSTFAVSYDALGTYRAVVDRTSGSLTLSKPGTWLWPFPGQYGKDWAPGGYIDLDPTSGERDYAGGARTYNGHTGADIGVPSFRQMDDGLHVVAAKGGTVVAVVDQHFDRVTSPGSNCGNETNVISVETAEGYVVDYAHVKQNSSLVAVNDTVVTGQPLAVVGSAGCSSGPHLHFEIRDGSDVLDPFELGFWMQPLPYVAPLSVMDVMVREGLFPPGSVGDPAPNVNSVTAGTEIQVAAVLAGGDVPDNFTAKLRNPSGAQVYTWSPTFGGPMGLSTWITPLWTLAGQLGTWTIEFEVNGVVDVTHAIQVVNP